jgi:hypothetical protein
MKIKLLTAVILWIALLFAGTGDGMADGKGIAILDRFSKEGADGKGIPPGWQAKTPGSASKIVFAAETEDPFLQIVCVNDNIAVGKKISFEIRKYPFLT